MGEPAARALLGVPAGGSAEDIRAAFEGRARALDGTGRRDELDRVVEAYRTLAPEVASAASRRRRMPSRRAAVLSVTATTTIIAGTLTGLGLAAHVRSQPSPGPRGATGIGSTPAATGTPADERTPDPGATPAAATRAAPVTPGAVQPAASHPPDPGAPAPRPVSSSRPAPTPASAAGSSSGGSSSNPLTDLLRRLG